MHYLFILLPFLSALPTYHTIPLALYDLKLEQELISLNIHFDKEDMNETLDISDTAGDFEKAIIQYFKDHTSWVINEMRIDFEVDKIWLKKDHYVLECSAKMARSDVQSIDIENTCLINIRNHSNIINVRYDDKDRTFRLHKGRTQTQIEL